MALISPGVSVTVTDDSFFIPASAPTVPLIFIATSDEKNQVDGVTPADGTFEYNIIRTVTSLTQSTQLYGTPAFKEVSGEQFHGDARNEYGVFALNQFLGVANRAYVVRANVNLDDNLTNLQTLWDNKILESQIVLQNLITNFINEYNIVNNLIATDIGFKTAVSDTEYMSLVETATSDLFASYSFSTKNPGSPDTGVKTFFIDDQMLGSPAGLPVYANGFSVASTGIYSGLTYLAANGGSPAGQYTAVEGGTLLVSSADDFKWTKEFLNLTALGENDAARRSAIITALQAAINSNTSIRSENFDYNLILCPGYPEVVDELAALVTDIKDEALVIADTPVDKNVDQITNPSTGWATTTARVRSEHVAYYYPWALASNLDGKNVCVAPSGVALRTYAVSDTISFVWFAPAGLRRGKVTGVTSVGYVSGTLGTATTFNEMNLNPGERDALYQYLPGGDINPIVFFPGKGFVVWGQKTSAVAASAMDRVNVSRMIKYIKRQLRKNTLSFVFEPNDQLTRDNLKAVVDGFLGDLIIKRGLYDFATICDESNNTPDRIDRNEMYIDIALKPVKAAEFIYIPIRIVNTGAEI